MDGSLTYRQVFDFDRFGNMYRKAASNPSTGQANPLPFTQIEESDISKATNRFATQTTYDEAGSVVSDAKFRGMGFGYDANARMVKATKANVPDALSVYDAAGMRVAERVNDTWRFSVYDIGGKIVAEYGGTPATDEGGVKYLLSDWQGSNRAVVSNGGFVKARMDYTAYGEDIASGVGLRTQALGYSATSADSLRQRYGLTERDSATGLDHTPWRKNENRAGRWTSPDPYLGSMLLGDPQTFNRYSYVANQPTNFIDPSGLQIVTICQWWTWVYDGGPNDGEEVPGAVRWLVCWTVDDGRGAPGRVPLALPNDGTTSLHVTDADEAKGKIFNECINDQTTGIPSLRRAYDSTVNGLRRQTDNSIAIATALYLAVAGIAFFTGDVPALILATLAYVYTAKQLIDNESIAIQTETEHLHNDMAKKIAECAEKAGFSFSGSRNDKGILSK